jgi:hypothetical protein
MHTASLAVLYLPRPTNDAGARLHYWDARGSQAGGRALAEAVRAKEPVATASCKRDAHIHRTPCYRADSARLCDVHGPAQFRRPHVQSL